MLKDRRTHMTKLKTLFIILRRRLIGGKKNKNLSRLRFKHGRCVTDDKRLNPAYGIQYRLFGLLLCCPRLLFSTAGL